MDNYTKAELLFELYNRGSAQTLSHLIPEETLSWFQTVAVANHLITGATLVSLDTGLGKTYVAAACISQYLNAEELTLFIANKSTAFNNYTSIKKLLPKADTLFIYGKSSSVGELTGLRDRKPEILFLSYEALRNEKVLRWLQHNITLYGNMVADEIHMEIYEDTNTFQALQALRSRVSTFLALTATPLRVSPMQFINIMNLVIPEIIPKPRTLFNKMAVYDSLGNVVSFKDLHLFDEIVMGHFISVTRADLGIATTGEVKGITAPLSEEQFTILKENRGLVKKRTLIRTAQDNPTVNNVIEVIQDYKRAGKKGILYANIDVIKDYLRQRIEFSDIRVDILDGRVVSLQAQKNIEERFNNNEIDVLILNITVSLNLQCDYILFYEQTSDFMQVIGRGNRSLSSRVVDVYFTIFFCEEDVDFFFKHVYNNALLLKNFAKKDISSINTIFGFVASMKSALNKKPPTGIEISQ